MIEQTFPDNLEEPDFPRLYDFKVYMCLKKNARRSEEGNLNDNLPEWSDSEEQFPDDETQSKSGEVKDPNKDMANDIASYSEKEIGEVMEKLKRFQATLAEGKSPTIENVFNFQPSEDYKQEKLDRENDLKASIGEIEKMDALLKISYMKEKKAKLSRLQVEEETRTILTTLTNVTMTDKFKMNSEEFLKLLHDTDLSGAVKGYLDNGEIAEEEKETRAKEKKSDSAEDKNLRNDTQKKLNFVERNIELAKNGGGILSLTEEEKLRIETLLIDISEPKSDDSKNQKIESPTKPEFYALDEKSKSSLNDINQRLEAFSKEKPATASQANSSLLENLKLDKNIINKKRKNSPDRLIAVNKLLNRISGATDEEISPLSPEVLNRLIEEAVQSVGENESKPSPEVITDLVSNAKILMPKFKYRFKES